MPLELQPQAEGSTEALDPLAEGAETLGAVAEGTETLISLSSFDPVADYTVPALYPSLLRTFPSTRTFPSAGAFIPGSGLVLVAAAEATETLTVLAED